MVSLMLRIFTPHRVIIGENTSHVLIGSLKAQIIHVKTRADMLKCGKDVLMARCKVTHSAVSRLTSDERTTPLEFINANEEVRQANMSASRSCNYSLESM